MVNEDTPQLPCPDRKEVRPAFRRQGRASHQFSEQLRDYFERAVQQTEAAQTEMLKALFMENPDLARELESLLRAHQQTCSLFEEPVFGAAAESWSLAGTRLGAYEVVRKLASGG